MAVPAPTPVTTPVDELTVKTPVLELDHVPPPSDAVQLAVAPEQKDAVPKRVTNGDNLLRNCAAPLHELALEY